MISIKKILASLLLLLKILYGCQNESRIDVCNLEYNETDVCLPSLLLDKTVVFFMPSWCRPCRMKAAVVKRYLEGQADPKWDLLIIGLDEKSDRWLHYVAEETNKQFTLYVLARYPNKVRQEIGLGDNKNSRFFLLDRNARILDNNFSINGDSETVQAYLKEKLK